MAIFKEEALKRALKTGDKNVFILFGEDGYLKKLYIEKISKPVAAADDVFNYQRFEADSSLQEVYDAVQQFPMMNDKKVVILRDFDYAACDSDDYNKLIVLIGDVPETTVFILWFDALSIELKKNAKFDKIVKACDSAKGMAVNLEHREGPELEKMLNDGALKRGCQMEKGAARLLIENIGEDINTLHNELEKLCAVLQVSIPGVPSIYYGDEQGMCGVCDPFNRLPFKEGDRELHDFYAGLARLRNENAVLQTGEVRFIAVSRDMLCVLRFDESLEGDVFLAVINRGERSPFTLSCSAAGLGNYEGIMDACSARIIKIR